MSEPTFFSLVKSIAISTLLAQVVGLLLLGMLRSGGSVVERFVGVLALPMTLVFFGIPAFFLAGIAILVAVYGLRAIGVPQFTPLLVGLIGLGWIISMFIRNPAPTGALPGYDQALHLNVAAVLITWAVYAQLRFQLGGSHA